VLPPRARRFAACVSAGLFAVAWIAYGSAPVVVLGRSSSGERMQANAEFEHKAEMGQCMKTAKLAVSNQVCQFPKLIGDAMRAHGNSPEYCAAAAAADPQCGDWVNYNAAWSSGAGACHCIQAASHNAACSNRSGAPGWSIFRVVCDETHPSLHTGSQGAGMAPPSMSAFSPMPAPSPSVRQTRPQSGPSPAMEAAAAAATNNYLAAAHVAADGQQCYFRFQDASKAGHAKCFCHLAGNWGCSKSGCACQQGCGVVWRHSISVTFPNLKKASGCSPGAETSLLTIPKSYLSDLRAVQQKCGQSIVPLLTALLWDGYQSYQERVAKGPVQQCVHSPAHISIPWLHLHSFCPHGSVDGMPLSPPQHNSVAYCETMHEPNEAAVLAQRIVAWASQQR